MDRVRAVVGRHPMTVDVALAVLLALVNARAVANAGTGMAGWFWFAAAHLPLVWRRRAPVAVFWTVLAVALTVWTAVRVDEAFPVTIILVAVYALARYRLWRQLWPAASGGALTLAAAWWQGELAGTDLIALAAILAAAGLLGVTVRTRRAYVVELEERARRLERERDQQARLTAAAERARIAREMHDIVAHNLAVMVALADGAALTATAAPRRAADTLATVATTGRQALDEMQRLLGVLRDGDQAPAGPLELTPQPGLDDLNQLMKQVRAAGLRATLARQGTPGEWDPGAGLAVYRIVQEALTNTLKHAGPRATAQVRLRFTTTGVDVEVTDDGTPRDGHVRGHGLAGMAERATAYGGTVEAGPLPGTGWRVHARLRLGATEAIT